jgi:hypothetical protein
VGRRRHDTSARDMVELKVEVDGITVIFIKKSDIKLMYMA